MAKKLLYRDYFLVQAVASVEDSPKGIVRVSEDVERVRRAHHNDLEAIPQFLIISLVFILTNPSVFLAVNLIRLAAVARIVHTIVYAMLSLQPHRAISFTLCYAVTFYMAIRSAIYFL